MASDATSVAASFEHSRVVPSSPRQTNPPRRCFICLTDQLPSEPASAWVDPCPCTLEAHNDCMLSWVLDCERNSKPLVCPVCKHQITLEGPWDPFVALDDAVRKRFSNASPYVLCTAVFVGVHISLQMYGTIAMSIFAGKHQTLRYLLGVGGSDSQKNFQRRIKSMLVLTNVAPTLVLGKMLPSLSNAVFLPTASLYGIYHALHDDHFLAWPPSPALVLTAFPVLRGVYYSLYRELVLPHELKLNRQLLGLPPIPENQGRRGRPANDRRNVGWAQEGVIGFLQGILDALGPDDDDEDRFNVRNHIEIVEEEVPADEADGDGQVMVEVVIEEVEVGEEENGQGDMLQEPPAEQPNIPIEDPVDQNGHEAPVAPPQRQGLGSILSSLSNQVASALLLPGVSYVVGEVLRLALPKSWTSVNSSLGQVYSIGNGRPMSRPGLLQQQWGRSLIGGCLWVVLRDMVRVYAKHRKVALSEKRKVKNVARKNRSP